MGGQQTWRGARTHVVESAAALEVVESAAAFWVILGFFGAGSHGETLAARTQLRSHTVGSVWHEAINVWSDVAHPRPDASQHAPVRVGGIVER